MKNTTISVLLVVGVRAYENSGNKRSKPAGLVLASGYSEWRALEPAKRKKALKNFRDGNYDPCPADTLDGFHYFQVSV